jgi:imidazolonepropionase-like amidohydrolase
LVQDREIVEVSTSDQVEISGDVPAYNLGGKTLMPGLIDGHVHLLAYAGEGRQDIHLWNVLTFVEEQTLHAAANARKALEAGVTTVRDMAGSRPEISVKNASKTAGHADMFCPANIERRLWRTADGPDECRQRVREYARDGADLIKICTSGGVLSVGDKAEWRNYTLAETQVIVDEAHGLGMRVAAHAHTRAGIRQALMAGVDTLEHGTLLDDELIEMMVEQGTRLCPTLAISSYLLRHGEARGVPAASLAKAKTLSEGHHDALRKAYQAGVRIFMGTDSCNTMAFGRHAWELELMQKQIGMSPMEVIVAATCVAAEALDLADTVGTVTPGKRADLLVIDGDPLTDLTIMQDSGRLLGIFRDGRLMIDRGLPDFE